MAKAKPTRESAAARHDARGLTSLQPADRLSPGELPPVWVSLTAAGVRLDLHPRTLRRAIQAGELAGYKFGSALRVRLDELDAWAESKAMPDPWGGKRRPSTPSVASGGAR